MRTEILVILNDTGEIVQEFNGETVWSCANVAKWIRENGYNVVEIESRSYGLDILVS